MTSFLFHPLFSERMGGVNLQPWFDKLFRFADIVDHASPFLGLPWYLTILHSSAKPIILGACFADSYEPTCIPVKCTPLQIAPYKL